MAKYVGRRASLGIAKETSRGVAVNPSFWIPYGSISFDNKVEKVRIEEGFENIQDSSYAYVVKKYGEGDFEAPIRDKALGLILTAVFGQTPTTTGSGPYTHSFSLLNSNQHQSLSILVQDPNGATMFPLAMINSFEISVEPEGVVSYAVSFRSKAGNDWTSQNTDFSDLGELFLHQHLQVRVADNLAGLSGASEISIRRLTFTIEKNIMDWDDVGSVQAGDILNRQFSVSGSLELAYNDQTWRNYMLDETYKAMEIYLYKDANSSLKIQMPRVDFFSWEPVKDLDEIATQTIEFKANYDAVNSNDCISTCELINQQASY